LYASDGKIVFWNISERKIEKTIDFLWDDIRVFDITKNGRLIASTDSSRVVKIWDCWENQMVAELEAWNSICLTFSPDGKLLASGHTTAFGDDYTGQSIISIWQVPEQYYS
jgi:WD40 repeat protein